MLFNLPLISITDREDVASEDLDATCDRTVEPDDGSQQNRFTRAGRADDTEDFAAEHFEVEAVVDGLVTEPVYKVLHAYDRLVRLIGHGQICKAEKKIENPASITITRKIASTTDNVVSRPTLSALPDTWNPS